MAVPHPLSQLSLAETESARAAVRGQHPNTVIQFRLIFLLEPPKTEVVAFLELEHAGKLTAQTKRPARLAQVWYDVIGNAPTPQYYEAFVNLDKNELTDANLVDSKSKACLAK